MSISSEPSFVLLTDSKNSSKHRETQKVCAVKIIEVDVQDYKADVDAKDDTIKEFIRETSILQSLKDNRAQNVNIIFEAFSVDTQLWIVTEYCPGGSLTTLMKATPKPGLAERYIIPIAREVAVALKYVHEAGVIHRDIKCELLWSGSMVSLFLTSRRRKYSGYGGWTHPAVRFWHFWCS